MNSKLIKLLTFLCLCLCLVLAGEWVYVSYTQKRLLASISPAKPQAFKTDELPEIKLAKQPEESYVDLVARPLFIKGRRPVDEPRPEAMQTAANTDTFDWQLTGIYSTKKNVSALFGRSGSKIAKDNHRRINVGDEIDGWKLTQINKDKVMLKQGGKEKVLPLRKPKPKALPAESTPAPVPTRAPAPAPIPAPEPGADATEETPEEGQQ